MVYQEPQTAGEAIGSLITVIIVILISFIVQSFKAAITDQRNEEKGDAKGRDMTPEQKQSTDRVAPNQGKMN